MKNLLCDSPWIRKEEYDMEERDRLERMMEKLIETEEERKKYAKKQFYMLAVMAACTAAVLLLAFFAYISLVPKFKSSAAEIETAAKELHVISKQLSEADLAGLVKHVDRMAVTSEEGVKEALEKIESIDIDELNHAIKSLSDVVSPLAKLMGRFN